MTASATSAGTRPVVPLQVDWAGLLPTEAADWAFVLGNWEFLFLGVVVTAALTLTSVLLGLLVGLPAGAVEVYGSGPLRWFVQRAGVVVRGTPILVIMVFIFFVVPLPLDFGTVRLPVPGTGETLSVASDSFLTAMVGLGLRSAAYQSQIFRGALQSVSEGQMEAARAVGLSKVRAIQYVVLPQALRRSIPGFQNEYTIVLKDTSIAFAIGLSELLTRGYNIFTQRGGDTAVLEVFLLISLVYFVLTISTNQALDYLGRVYAIPGGDR